MENIESEVFKEPESTEEQLLTEQEERDFIEAVEIGSDRQSFDIMNNSVEMHTLTIKETLLAAKAAKEYKDTDAKWLAMKTAIVAAAIDSINGEAFYKPISLSDPVIPAKFKLLTENYYSEFVSECYNKYEKMEAKQKELSDKLKKAQA